MRGIVCCCCNCNSNSEAYSTKDESKPLGVSVHWLKYGFLETEVMKAIDLDLDASSRIYEIEDLSSDVHGIIRRKGSNRLCPDDGQLGASYVDCLDGEDNVGPSTIMLSYGWGNSIGDIVDALIDYCDRFNANPKRTYVWICCLCNNQHRVAQRKKEGEEISFEEFSSIFRERVTKISKVVAIMAPWRKPIYVSRVWCIFELFTASENEGCQLDIAMPPREKQDMVNCLDEAGVNGIHLLFDTMAKTDISSAEASEPADKERIMSMVTESSGFDILNNKVNNLLRGWVKDGILEAVQSELELMDSASKDGSKLSTSQARLCTNVGNIMFRYADYDQALSLQKRALSMNQNTLGEQNLITAASHCNVGSALTAKGDHEAALLEYQKYHSIHLELLGEDHSETARSHFSIGLVFRKMGRLHEALEEHQRALNIRNTALEKFHTDTAASHNEIGGMLQDIHRKEEFYDEKESVDTDVLILLHYESALEIREKVYGEYHPDTAQSYHNMGAMRFNMWRYRRSEDLTVKENCYNEGLAQLDKALNIKQKVLGNDHPSTILTFDLIRDAQHFKKEWDVFHASRGTDIYSDAFIDHDDDPSVMSAMPKFERARSLMGGFS